MQPYVPHSNSLPAPTPLVPRSAGDANLQSLLGFLAQQHQQQGGGGSAEGGSSSSAHNGGNLEPPIRPEAMRVLSQTLGGPSQGVPGTQQLLAGLTGGCGRSPLCRSRQPACCSAKCSPCQCQLMFLLLKPPCRRTAVFYHGMQRYRDEWAS